MGNRKLKKICFFALLFLFLFSHFLFLSYADALDIKKTVLPNGLTVLHSEKQSLPIVMVTLLVKVSPLNEPKEKAGLANITAELLTEGTKNRTSSEISEETEFIGASLDASAGKDYKVVTLSVLKKDIHKGFELFSDILLHPVFSQTEIERKKALIKGSLRQSEEDPSFLAERAFKKEVFGEHPYGRLIEGSVETIDTITREDLTKFYSDYFLPNNSVLSVVGDLTANELHSLISKYLGEWKKSNLLTTPTYPVDKTRDNKVIKIDKDLTQATIMLGHFGISRESPDYYAVAVMNYILGSGGF